MFHLQNYSIYKYLLVLFLLLGLSWISLFIFTPTTSAATKTAAEIYVQPIPGLKAGLFGISTQTFIEALTDDNYQAYCASPSQKIGPEVLGEYRRYLELYFGQVDEKDKDLETTVTDPSSITNPNILDDSGDGFKGESVVNYQYRSKTDADAVNSNITTSSSNRQLSLFQQCEVQKATRRDVIARCQDLEDIELKDCPLNIDIPGMAGLQIADIDINCNDLKDPEKFAQIDKTMLRGMANTPNASVISTNKKPAYLMICFRQKESTGMWFDKTRVDNRKFYLSSFWSWINEKLDLGEKDECSIRTILVDVALTEQNPYLESYPLEAHDLTKKSFMSLSNQIVEEEVFKSARSARKELSLGEMSDGFDDNKRINLKDSDDEIKKALAFMVNGTAPSCDINAVRQEEAPTIGSKSTLDEGGAKYKSSERDAYNTWSNDGILASLKTILSSILSTGKRIEEDFEGRTVTVESFIFAPYSNNSEKVSLEEFFVPKINYDQIKAVADESWPTHVEFNNFLVSSGTNEECESYTDYEDCSVETRCDENSCWEVEVCKTKNFCVTGKDLGQQFSSQTSDIIRSNSRPILSLLPKDSPSWKHANNTLGSLENISLKPNIEQFLKSGGGSDDGGGGGEFNSICEVADAYNIDCDFFKAVYAVETCSGSVMPTYSYGDLNCCNSIGYCGPMQFAGGMAETVAPGENLKICKEEDEGMDNFILAARWMLIKKWCNFNSSECLSIPNPYDWKESYIESEGNSNITTQTEVEDFILGWYGSINQIEDRVGWPEGSTYVDAVMEYLETGSLWGTCGYQNP